MNPPAQWLTNPSQIADASLESLRRSLETSDGMGKEFKAKVVDEILRRAITAARLETLRLDNPINDILFRG